MTDEEKKLMVEYGITSEPKTTFHFKGHRYDRLQDAVNYAIKLGQSSQPPLSGSSK